MELLTVKEYCKQERITDAGARKRVSQKLVKSVILDESIYIVTASKVKDLKQIIKSKNAIIKQLKTEAQIIINRENEVQELKEKIKKLESKLEMNTEKKEELYERVINHITQFSLPQKVQDDN